MLLGTETDMEQKKDTLIIKGHSLPVLLLRRPWRIHECKWQREWKLTAFETFREAKFCIRVDNFISVLTAAVILNRCFVKRNLHRWKEIWTLEIWRFCHDKTIRCLLFLPHLLLLLSFVTLQNITVFFQKGFLHEFDRKWISRHKVKSDNIKTNCTGGFISRTKASETKATFHLLWKMASDKVRSELGGRLVGRLRRTPWNQTVTDLIPATAICCVEAALGNALKPYLLSPSELPWIWATEKKKGCINWKQEMGSLKGVRKKGNGGRCEHHMLDSLGLKINDELRAPS